MNSENIYTILYSTSPDLIYTYPKQNWKQAIYPFRFVFLFVYLFRSRYAFEIKDRKILQQMAGKQPTKAKEICCL